MESTIDIPIRFISANSIINNLTNPLLFALFFAFIVACGIALVLYFCKKTSVSNLEYNNSNSKSINNKTGILEIVSTNKKVKIALIVLFVALIASLSVALSLGFSNKALADSQDKIDSTELIAYVNESDGEIELKNASIINNSTSDVMIQNVSAKQTSINGKKVAIDLNTDGANLYNNNADYSYASAVNESIDQSKDVYPADQSKESLDQSDKSSENIIINGNGGSIPISGSIKGLSANEAKTLIDTYEPAAFSVDTKKVNGDVTQVTNYNYTNSDGNTSPLHYMPSFSDDNPSYLKEHNVTYYIQDKQSNEYKPYEELNNKINSTGGITMAELSNYYLNDDGSFKTLYVGSNAQFIKFYGIVNESFELAFGKTSAMFSDLSDDYKEFLTNQNIQPTSVYPERNDEGWSRGNWDLSTMDYVLQRAANPTINNIKFSEASGSSEQSFCASYKKVLGSSCDKAWSTRSTFYPANVDSWNAKQNTWDQTNPSEKLAVVLSLNFNTSHTISVEDDGYVENYKEINSSPINFPCKVDDGCGFAFFVNTIPYKTADKVICKYSDGHEEILNPKGCPEYYSINQINSDCTISVTTKDKYETNILAIRSNNNPCIFLPAFEGSDYLFNNGIYFYYKNEYGQLMECEQINNLIKSDKGCTMQDLASQIEAIKDQPIGKDLYTEAPVGTKFYTITNTTWKDAFDTRIENTPQYDFTDNFKRNLQNAGLPTTSVYTAKPGDDDYENWDACSDEDTPEPSVNHVKYSVFFNSYKNILNGSDYAVWGSKLGAHPSVNPSEFWAYAYCINHYTSENQWIRDNVIHFTPPEYAVVITLNF